MPADKKTPARRRGGGGAVEEWVSRPGTAYEMLSETKKRNNVSTGVTREEILVERERQKRTREIYT